MSRAPGLAMVMLLVSAALLVATTGACGSQPASKPDACSGDGCGGDPGCPGDSCEEGDPIEDVFCACGETVTPPQECPPPPYRLQFIDPPVRASTPVSLVLEVRPSAGMEPASADLIVLAIELNGIAWTPPPKLEPIETQDGRWELRLDLGAFPGTSPAPGHDAQLRVEASLDPFTCVEPAVASVVVGFP